MFPLKAKKKDKSKRKGADANADDGKLDLDTRIEMLLKGKVGVAPAFLQLGMSSDEEDDQHRSKVASRRSSSSSR